jgi:polar amino acid transport system permease protein
MMTHATTPSIQDAVRSGDATRVVKQRHPVRWLVGAVLLLGVLLTLRSVASNERFGWPTVAAYLFNPQIVDGVYLTLILTLVCMLIGVGLGTVLAIMRLSANPVAASLALGYVAFFRGTPVLVQLIFWFNFAALYPHLSFGIPGVDVDANALISPLLAGILGLGLHEAAYMAEIIRGGIRSIDGGQVEAGRALGMRKSQVLRRIVLPQAMTVIIPPTGNEAVGMLKTSSLVSVLAVGELLYSAQLIYSSNYETIPLLIVASLWYLALTAVFSAGQFWLERRFSPGHTGVIIGGAALDQFRRWVDMGPFVRRGK